MANTVIDRLERQLDKLKNVNVLTLNISNMEKVIAFPSLYMYTEIPKGLTYKGVQLKINHSWY